MVFNHIKFVLTVLYCMEYKNLYANNKLFIKSFSILLIIYSVIIINCSNYDTASRLLLSQAIILILCKNSSVTVYVTIKLIFNSFNFPIIKYKNVRVTSTLFIFTVLIIYSFYDIYSIQIFCLIIEISIILKSTIFNFLDCMQLYKFT